VGDWVGPKTDMEVFEGGKKDLLSLPGFGPRTTHSVG